MRPFTFFFGVKEIIFLYLSSRTKIHIREQFNDSTIVVVVVVVVVLVLVVLVLVVVVVVVLAVVVVVVIVVLVVVVVVAVVVVVVVPYACFYRLKITCEVILKNSP